MNIADALKIVRRYTVRAPVDVSSVATDLGLPVKYQFLPDDVSGAIKASPDGQGRYFIEVNAMHFPVRQRFTIAHEIGHFIYHRDLLGKGTGDTRAYRADPSTGLPNPHITPQEKRQANNFAANLLMPQILLNQYKALGVVSPKQLAPIFEVSEDAMRIRLGYSRYD